MTNLINPKPRFGYNPTAKTMYDYVDSRDVPVDAHYQAADGVWDLTKVRDLILAGEPIEAGRISLVKRPPKPAAAAAAKPAVLADKGPPAPAGLHLMTPPQRTKAFTPVQAAALGVSVNELASGLTAAQLANIREKITPARAITLGLTAEQKGLLGLVT